MVVASIKELLTELYEPETRTKLVAGYATALGAEKLLTTEQIEELATLATIDGFKHKKAELKEMAAPYIAKAYVAEGRKELVTEATDLASEKVIKPVTEYTSEKVTKVKEATKELASERVIKPTKEFAEPYITKSTEIAAPYIAKIESKRAEIVASKRYEKAMATIKLAREHPMEYASELKSKAIDLLKYEHIASYREYIQSEEFQSDTMRLIKVELPTIASDAASRGIEQIKQSASSLAEDIEAKRGQIIQAIEHGYSVAQNIELAQLQDKFKLLLSELQVEAMDGVKEAQTNGFSLKDAVARMKKMAGAIESILITPLLAKVEDTQDDASKMAPADEIQDEKTDSEPVGIGDATLKEEAEAETESDEAAVDVEDSDTAPAVD